MWSLLVTLVIGLVVGLLARFVLPGRDSAGLVVTALVGVAGSFLATYAGRELGWYAAGDTAGFIASVLGAIVLLLVLRALRGGKG